MYLLTKDNFIVFYANLKKVKVKTGDLVKVGRKIGTESITGLASDKNKHLHLSLHFDWKSAGKDYWTNVGYLPASAPFSIQDCNDFAYSVEDLKCKRVTSTATVFCSK